MFRGKNNLNINEFHVSMFGLFIFTAVCTEIKFLNIFNAFAYQPQRTINSNKEISLIFSSPDKCNNLRDVRDICKYSIL